ncbi:MAG: sodium:solute symporter family protein [Planctomycetota bacterium]|nr:sodium:solute symporter family protein [Planctomycetota bacterium]MDP6988980.1 sodium:solute symporter family protein [Planctomycetota bacterium]
MMLALAATDPTPLYVIGGYLLLLVGLGFVTKALFRGTSSDYFVATRSIGPFLLLMSVFGTTMTAFALVGSTGKAYDLGIGVYGLMASSSAVVHSLVFFLVGMRLWAIGKRHGYVTQIQFFRDRFESSFLGSLLFPILVALVIPYLLIGLLGAGAVMSGVTRGMFPDTFAGGAVPSWLTGMVICGVVLFYIFSAGLRGAAWANAFQTVVFMITGVVAFLLISNELGGLAAASHRVLANAPSHLAREGLIGHGQFLTYGLVPLSVGMFPHLFQHWLTARSARTFRLSIIAHPVFIMIVWVPCILIGIWALGAGIEAPGGNSNAVLGKAVAVLLANPLLSGLLTAGILAAIMSSLDSQFVCLGTMFTHDVVLHRTGPDRFDDAAKVALGRGFIVFIVVLTYLLSLFPPPHIFDLAVWCFSGFASLFPLVFAALYWRRATRAGAIASVCVMAATWSVLFYDGLIRPRAVEGDYLVLGLMPVTFIFLASAATLVVVSLLTAPPSRATVDRFVFRGG